MKCLSELNADFVTVSDIDLFAIVCLLCSNLSLTKRHLSGSNFFLKIENGLVVLWVLTVGGHTRLHLLDFGSGTKDRGGTCLSLSALGSVLLAIANEQRYLPHQYVFVGILCNGLTSAVCRGIAGYFGVD